MVIHTDVMFISKLVPFKCQKLLDNINNDVTVCNTSSFYVYTGKQAKKIPLKKLHYWINDLVFKYERSQFLIDMNIFVFFAMFWEKKKRI